MKTKSCVGNESEMRISSNIVQFQKYFQQKVYSSDFYNNEEKKNLPPKHVEISLGYTSVNNQTLKSQRLPQNIQIVKLITELPLTHVW